MDQNFFHCSKPVLFPNGHFIDITFNGVQFLLLDAVTSEIYKYDVSLCFVEAVNLERNYTNICYDEQDNCYWALSNNSATNLFQLDESLNEVGQTRMHNVPQCNVNNICFDQCSNTICISFSQCIGFIDKCCKKYHCLNTDCNYQSIQGVLVMPQCRIIVLSSNQKECIHLIRPNCNKKTVMDIPEGFCVCGLCCEKSTESSNCKKYSIYILLTQICNHKSFIMHCTINCTEDCTTKCTKDCTRNELCKIINSIALEEVGISHILNAEGEKIQKAVECCSTIKELMEVNDSVRDTIIKITQLEIQLTIKLEMALRHCC